MSSNVTTLFPRFRTAGPTGPAPGSAPALSRLTAEARHGAESVYWLKENGELLIVLAARRELADPAMLAPYERFYAALDEKVTFFPQYYRFFLSIAMDCEDLGLPGRKSEALAQRVVAAGLPRHELSDVQRAEAARLLGRRGVTAFAHDPGLMDRLRDFCAQTRLFALPNHKAAYDLTHAVFYLSDYGRQDPRLEAAVITSLRFAGTVAFLDRDADLLAEICIALRYARTTPPALWEAFVARTMDAMRFDPTTPTCQGEDFHAYLVGNWALATAGRAGFARNLPDVRFSFRLPPVGATPLRVMSERLLKNGRLRSGDWEAARHGLLANIGHDAATTLDEAAKALDNFNEFYAHFARADHWDFAA